MNPLFVIPARGNSKSIPGKNIKLLAGKPLIAYTIEVALALSAVERIILTTDSEEIAAVGQIYGIVNPHIRPASLATDTAGSREVILDAMAAAEARGIEFDCVVLLQPTSPLRSEEDVRRSLAAWSPEIDMAVTVVAASCNPYYDCFEADSEGFLHVSKGAGLLTRRQQAPKAWQYNGAVYVITPSSIKQMSLGAFPRRIPVEMPRERSIDIDTPLDWIICETLLK